MLTPKAAAAETVDEPVPPPEFSALELLETLALLLEWVVSRTLRLVPFVDETSAVSLGRLRQGSQSESMQQQGAVLEGKQ